MTIETPAQPIVLVIDPDPLTMTGIAAALHLSGYECHCARDRAAALKAADSLSLDLIISDVQVGADSGLAICTEIQTRSHNRDVSLMFVSSHQAPDIVRRSHDAGGVYYLRKPFDPDVLLELADRALWMPHLVQANLNNESSRPKTAPTNSMAPPKLHRAKPGNNPAIHIGTTSAV